jgi:hypothetical protein
MRLYKTEISLTVNDILEQFDPFSTGIDRFDLQNIKIHTTPSGHNLLALGGLSLALSNKIRREQ